MSTWTPERYRDLARQCRTRAERSKTEGSDFLLRMAEEYDRRAEQLASKDDAK